MVRHCELVVFACAFLTASACAQGANPAAQPGSAAWARLVMQGTPPRFPAVWHVRPITVLGTDVYAAGSAFTPPHAETAYVSRFDPDGNQLWTALGNGAANAVAADGSGVYLGGSIEVFGFGTYGFVYKFDVNGKLLWSRTTSVPRYEVDHTSDVLGATTNAAGVMIAGEGWLDDGDNASNGAFLRQYDGAGNVVWTKRLDPAVPVSATAPDAGGMYAGSSTFLARFDAGGNLLWSANTAGAGEYVYSMAAYAGAVYVTGFAASGSFVRKYDASGVPAWTQASGSGFSYTSVAADAGGVYAGGSTTVPLSTALTGTSDAFVSKFDPAGNLLWTYQSGVAGAAAGTDAIASGAEGIYVGVSAAIPTPGGVLPTGDALLLFLPVRGDVNGDGKVDCTDVAMVKGSMGRKSGQLGFDWRADLNFDGAVNGQDLQLVLRGIPPGARGCGP